jgi:hypothetical protein
LLPCFEKSRPIDFDGNRRRHTILNAPLHTVIQSLLRSRQLGDVKSFASTGRNSQSLGRIFDVSVNVCRH